MSGNYKYNPLAKKGFDLTGKNSSAEFTGVVGVDYDTVYEAIADGKKIIMLLTDTVETQSWGNLIHTGERCEIIGVGSQKRINLSVADNYNPIPGTEILSDIYFRNIEIRITSSNYIFRKHNRIFLDNCKITNTTQANLTEYTDNEISGTSLHIEFSYSILIFVIKEFDVLKITSKLSGAQNSYIYIAKGTIKHLETFGNFRNYLNQQYFALSANYTQILSANFNHTGYAKLYLNDSGISNGKGKVGIRLSGRNSFIKNCELNWYSVFTSGFEENISVENCEIDYMKGSALSDGYATFLNFSNNKINQNLKIYLPINFDNCIFNSLILYSDNVNIENCKIVNGTIDINGRDKIILTNNRTLTPIDFTNGTNIEESNNILI